MNKFVAILFIMGLFTACSKQSTCFCNEGNGEYEYLPPSTNAQSSGTVNASGDLDQECVLQDRFLKEYSSNTAYCEMK